jgi:hypothetical protein
VSEADDVLAAALRRADALARGDAAALAELLHVRFGWISHRGEVLDRAAYLAANAGVQNRWYAQDLVDPSVDVVGDVAVLRCVVVDTVDVAGTGSGRRTYRMRMTQTWVRAGGRWQCLAGHAGPLLDD